MQMCEEMKLLRKELDARGIEWHDESSILSEKIINDLISKGFDRRFVDTSMFRTHFEYGGYFYSVIYGWGSYGGFDCFSDHDRGLLECMTKRYNNGDPIGFLTVKDVLNMIDGAYTEEA